jgi:hypothetical protein
MPYDILKERGKARRDYNATTFVYGNLIKWKWKREMQISC